DNGQETLAEIALFAERNGDAAAPIAVARRLEELCVHGLFAAGKDDKALASFLFDGGKRARRRRARISRRGRFGARNRRAAKGRGVSAPGLLGVSQGFLDSAHVQLNRRFVTEVGSRAQVLVRGREIALLEFDPAERVPERGGKVQQLDSAPMKILEFH